MTGHDLTTLAQKMADNAPLTDEERQLAAQLLCHAGTAQANNLAALLLQAQQRGMGVKIISYPEEKALVTVWLKRDGQRTLQTLMKQGAETLADTVTEAIKGIDVQLSREAEAQP